MNKTMRIFLGAGLMALLLITLVVGTVVAQGPTPWRCRDNWGSGMMGYGMMQRGWGGTWQPGTMDPSQCPFSGDTPSSGGILTLDDAQAIAEQYLNSYGSSDLEIAEVMQFSQNFYVEVREASTGINAMELLIDPSSGAVHPEPGPNMMWNTKYGHMGGRGMMGGWYRQFRGDMTVTEDEAIGAAQSWLDTNMPGVSAGDEAEPFYGYYTIHTLTDGEISGMLSVNGYTGRVWYHSWHGAFIDMTAEHGT